MGYNADMGFLQRKADALRKTIREKIIGERDRHAVTVLIVAHAKSHYDHWEMAAVSQVMSIYKLSWTNACAIVSEMS